MEVNGPVCHFSARTPSLFTLRPLCKQTLPRPSSLFSSPSSLSLSLSLCNSHCRHCFLLSHIPRKMPEAAVSDAKSPKTPRRLKTGCEPLRQVHFHSPGSNADTKPTTSFNSAPFSAAATTTANGESINVHTAAPAPDNQPTSFPQLGAPPHSTLGSDQWHTSIDPSQSVKLPGQPFAGGFAPGLTPGFTCAPPQTHLASPFSAVPQVSAPFTTYIGIPPQLHQHQHLLPQHHFTTASMADYQNAAPMASGVNFQPPVPDTTFGPIPHVYVPRFDGGFVPAAVQVGLPSVQFVSAPAAACSTTVVMPKTFCYYSNGFTYYASRPAAQLLLSTWLFFSSFGFVLLFWSNLRRSC